MAIRIRNDLTRRRVIASGASAAALAAIGGIARPSISRRGRPAAGHPRRAVGRRLGRFGGVVWARADRPARMLVEIATTDSFKNIRARRVRRCAAGERSHRQGADRGPARRAGHLLSRPLPGPRLADHRGRAGGRPLPHRAGRPPLALVRLVGRHRRPGLGHRRSRAAACAPTRRCSATGRTSSSTTATPSTPTGRSPPSRSSRTAASGRTSSPRRSRSRPRRSPSSAATSNTTCSTRTCAPSTPRCRSSANGTTTRSPTTGGRASR